MDKVSLQFALSRQRRRLSKLRRNAPYQKQDILAVGITIRALEEMIGPANLGGKNANTREGTKTA